MSISKIKKVGLIITGIILFIYLLPFFVNGIFNAGTLAGVGVFGSIFVIFIFLDKLIEIRKVKKIKVLTNVLLSILISFVLLFVCTLGYVISGTIDNTENESTLIILGCAVHGERPSRPLNQRINKAYQYLLKNKSSVAILSGGQGPDELISEALCMYNVLTEKGIDADRLILEDESKSTFENIRNSKKIIEENNLSDKVVIVTNDYHIRRAEIVAFKEGLKPKRLAAFSDLSPVFYTRDTLGVWATLGYYLVNNK